jgi:hypothetical protein
VTDPLLLLKLAVIRNLTLSFLFWFGVSYLLTVGLSWVLRTRVDVWLVYSLVLLGTIYYFRINLYFRINQRLPRR